MKKKIVKKPDSSALDRKDICNNPYALDYIQKEVGLRAPNLKMNRDIDVPKNTPKLGVFTFYHRD